MRYSVLNDEGEILLADIAPHDGWHGRYFDVVSVTLVLEDAHGEGI